MGEIERELSQFMCDHREEMSDLWIQNLYTSGVGIYFEAKTSQSKLEDLKYYNGILNTRVTEYLIRSESVLKNWADQIGENRNQTNTPLLDMVKNFSIFSTIYNSFLEKFIIIHASKVTGVQAIEWGKRIHHIFNHVLELVIDAYIMNYEETLKSQQKMIVELSSPVIKIAEGIGVLPLVGEIDTYRANHIISSTLIKVSELELDHLIIDLSGVPIIDTMVANEIYQLCGSIDLLGVQSIITGIRPELAQTSVNLGLNLSKIKTFAHLSQAIKFISFQII